MTNGEIAIRAFPESGYSDANFEPIVYWPLGGKHYSRFRFGAVSNAGKIGKSEKKVEPVNAHYHRLDVLAEFEKISSSNTLWLWTLADSICGAAVMAVTAS